MNTQTQTLGVATSKKKAPILALAVFGVLAIIGIVCWFTQLTEGLAVTNLSTTNMWGLYIVGFMIFTGVAAGSLFFSALPSLCDKLAEFVPYTKISAFIAAISSVVAASLFIIVDIGNPERAWQFITSPNFSSPMYWDFLMLATYMVLSIVLTRALMTSKDGKANKVLAGVCSAAGLLVIITSFVFCFQVSREMWSTPVQPISFLIAAFAAALAVLIIVAGVLNKIGYIKISGSSLAKMGKVIAFFLAVELLIVVSEVLIGLYATGGHTSTITDWLLSGDGVLLFWCEVVALIAAIAIFVGKGTSLTKAICGAVVALIAIYLVKNALLQAELFNSALDYAGVGMYGQTSGLYYPSLIEIGVSVGIVAIGGFLVTLGLYRLPLNK